MYKVVRKALCTVVSQGLNDGHHFNISFVAYHAMVRISGVVKIQYPEEITIVLEYDLEIFDVF